MLVISADDVCMAQVMQFDQDLGIFDGTLTDLLKLVSDVICAEKAKDTQDGTLRKAAAEKQAAAIKNSHKRRCPEEVPLVSVCVQGGPGTVDTVLDAVVNGTPSLLVKGSGQAACILSDAVLLKHTNNLEDQNGMFDDKQQALSHFLSHDLKMERKRGALDYKELVRRLTANSKQLEAEIKHADWNKFRHDECRDWNTKIEADGARSLSAGPRQSQPAFLRTMGRTASIKDFVEKYGNDSLSDAMRIEYEGSLVVANVYGMRNINFCVTDFIRKVFQAVGHHQAPCSA